ncbi:hypothetical protein MD484_g279, partial [Candolleomyces efflorescens]
MSRSTSATVTSSPKAPSAAAALGSAPAPAIARGLTTSSVLAAPAPTCTTTLDAPGEPDVYSFFESATSTWQYIVVDPATKKAVVIDPVLDYNPASGKVTTKTADGLLSFVKGNGLDVEMLLETHAHADHLTAAQYLKHKLEASSGHPVPVGIGKRITTVQERFGKVYGIPKERLENAFDKYLEDDEKFKIGQLECKVVHLPGHTPDHVGYMCGKGLFVGDTIFYVRFLLHSTMVTVTHMNSPQQPDVGSARADFPGGSPTDLFKSISYILSLPPDMRVYAGHDYPPNASGDVEAVEGARCWSLVSEQRNNNVHIRARLQEIRDANANAVTEDSAKGGDVGGEGLQQSLMESFITWRANRDSTLGAPRLLHPSLQVNICAGKFPQGDAATGRWLRIPVQGVPEGL